MTRPLATFSFPTTVEFGCGTRSKLPAIVERHGRRALLVTDPGVARLDLYAELRAGLEQAGLEVAEYTGVGGNPTTVHVNEGAALVASDPDDLEGLVIVGIGGGSPLDAAKAIALRVSHAGEVTDYDDRLDGWQRITSAVPPIIAVPTTSGTGSEVGRSAVITNLESGLKTVIFSPFLLPRVALLDPELTVGLPPGLTAATGMDALSHNVEAFLAKGYHPMCDAIALEGIRLIAAFLERAVHDGGDLEAREGMAMASAMGAVAFQKGLGATHSLAHPLSTVSGLHHGLANALFLHRVMAFNLAAVPNRLARVGQALGVEGTASDMAKGAAGAVAELAGRIGIPQSLGAVGVDKGDLDALVEQAVADACHLSNPRPVTEADFRALYEDAF